MLRAALKEWAVICQALAEGRQALLLRKGGIAEAGGAFRVEHPRFWLYPTYVHQQRSGIKEEARPLLERVEGDRPPEGRFRLQHFAVVEAVHFARELGPLLTLAPLHLWSEETVRSRFNYRTPGLFVLAVRVHRMPDAVEVAESPAYAGCKSWVDLERDLPDEGAAPVLSDDVFAEVTKSLRVLSPGLAGG